MSSYDHEIWHLRTALRMTERQRDEFRRRALNARRALIDARAAFEAGNMCELGAILMRHTPVDFSKMRAALERKCEEP